MSIPGVECARRRRVYEGRHTSSLAILNELSSCTSHRHSPHHHGFYSFLTHPPSSLLASRLDTSRLRSMKGKEDPLVFKSSPKCPGPNQKECHKAAMAARTRLDERLRSANLINDRRRTVSPSSQSHHGTRNSSTERDANRSNAASLINRTNRHLGSSSWILKANEEGSFRARIDTLQKEAFNARIHDSKTGEEHEDCSVCLEHFSQGQIIIWLPCMHKFHSGCLMPWLENDSHCPYCRSSILK